MIKKISVILPSLNVSPYITKCVKSIITQSYPNLSLLCIDAGSTDGTLEILEEFASRDDRIRIIHSDRKSYGYQVNLGIREADGDYVAIVDTDDHVEPDFYESLLAAADQGVDVIKCNSAGFKEIDGIVMRTEMRRLPEKSLFGNKITGEKIRDFTLTDSSIWNGMYRRDFLLKNHITLSETPGAAYQDTGFKYQVFFHADSVYYLDRALYDYRMDRDESSTYSPKALHNVVYEYDRLINEIFPDQHISQEAWDALWKGEISYFFGEFYRTIRLADYDAARDFIAKPYNTYRRLAEDHPREIERALASLDDATRVNFDLIMHDIEAYTEYRHSVDRVEQHRADSIRRAANGRHLIIVGNGMRGKGLYQKCFDYDIPVDAYADNDSKKWSDETNYSPEILSPENAVEKYSDDVFFIANKNHEEELRQQLLNLGVDEGGIVIWHP